jgi:hypothetical protein
MRKRLITLVVVAIVSCLQYAGTIFFVSLLFYLYSRCFEEIKDDLYWGRTLWIAYKYLMLPTFFLGDIVCAFIHRRNMRVFMHLFIVALFIYFWFAPYQEFPYRSVAVCIVFTIMYLVGLYILRERKNR